MSITSEWNLKQKQLKEIIRKPELFDEARALFFDMHRAYTFARWRRAASPR